MMRQFQMPTLVEVEQSLLIKLFRHGGSLKEFSATEIVVRELADDFKLTHQQRTATLETVYRKEMRLKKSLLWHRLLFRCADRLAKKGLIYRPTHSALLIYRNEWMLTELGMDRVLALLGIQKNTDEIVYAKTYEMQRIIDQFLATPRIENYNPIDKTKQITTSTKQSVLRDRAFRRAVAEAYGFACAICGLKIQSPKTLTWEIQAAHIVPNRSYGRDDVCNGVALCRLHHWAFDVGWFTIMDNFSVKTSAQLLNLPDGFGRLDGHTFLRTFRSSSHMIRLPTHPNVYPHKNAIRWHRRNIFNR